jgi:hypothetical protein
MTIVFKHHRRTRNLGDAVCSPFDHLPDLAAGGVALDLADPTPAGSTAVVYGGGKIMGGLARAMGPADRAARVRVAWGVGTRHGLGSWWKYRRAFRAMTLTGSRDWGDTRFPFAPCVTCVDPGFDTPPAPRHAVVAYVHHWRTPEMGLTFPPDLPVMDNTAADLPTALAHIAGGETVISNSYHGTYWALLMGRRVLCIPFSGKFGHFRIAPGFSTPRDWRRDLHRAQRSDEMLGLCRAATADFAARVRDLLGG